MTDEQIISALKAGETMTFGCHGRNGEVMSLMAGLEKQAAVRDLFDPDPHEGLRPVLAEVDGTDPWGAIWARMRSVDGGFGRCGNAAGQMIFGFGVEGRGPSPDEAAKQWVAGARSLVAESR
ncbi:MAG TPA: hypothetical protein PKE59_00375 [Novosphingobium sp.]|nr:hypothetical protein [Novosphingobium sp.]